ncbi:MAG: hypothetical protein GC168_21130 [Candidatus Hydrogenedens sp.]|nr:hypothetical protein [Candidatus Hydrogenedens sp.]
MKTRFFLSACLIPVLLLTGCLNIEVPLPAVQLTLPLGNDLVFGIPTKSGQDKFTLDFPESCDVPSKAELEALVRDALGPFSGILVIKSVSLDEIDFTANTGDFDFIDFIELSVTSGEDTFAVSADLANESNVTAFAMTSDEPLNILDAIPDEGECVQGSITYNGALLTDAVTYDARLVVTITAVARI